MNLNLILPLKKIQVNQKEVKIPKLGLKHHNLLKDIKTPEENLFILIDSIHPGLTPAEIDFVSIHLLEFNGKIKNKVTKDNFEYDLSTLKIVQRLEFQFGGHTFKFRAPKHFESFGAIDKMLAGCLESVDDQKEDVDFLKMPAFVKKWADDITNTIAIDGPNGDIRGSAAIIGIFE